MEDIFLTCMFSLSVLIFLSCLCAPTWYMRTISSMSSIRGSHILYLLPLLQLQINEKAKHCGLKLYEIDAFLS